MNTRVLVGSFTAAAFALLMAACGGSSPTSPGGGSTPPPGGGTVGATLTINANGITPSNPTINAGQSITLVNNDGKAHEISSNPHPVHTECPPLNFGSLSPGQSRTSNAFATTGTCGFHDHLDPNNAAWQGQVTIR